MKNETTKLEKCVTGGLVCGLIMYFIDASVRVTRAESRAAKAERERDDWHKIAEALDNEHKDLFYELDYYKCKGENKEKES